LAQHRANIAFVLAALNFGAVLLGVATGGLAASVVALVVGGALAVFGVETGPEMGLAMGVFTGLAIAGWVAGLRSRHSHRFHGMVTGLVLAFLILVVARLGGSPASTPTVIWLAIVAVAVAGITGWMGGRRRPDAE
jgi:hypothetical protein